ncbi:MAG: carboxymuconolactone decarboxylase family protein [Pseudomonadota bacterium]
MTDFQIHDIDTATGATKDILETAKSRYGFVPNLIGGLSEAPQVADAYMHLGNMLGASSLKPEELHVVWFTLNTYHGCDYCMAAHTAIAKGQKIADDVIETARAGGDYADPKLQAFKVFTLEMVESRGWVKPEALEAFLAAGGTKANVLEIVMATAHKTISNYANHVIGTPVDHRFAPFKWERPAVAAE